MLMKIILGVLSARWRVLHKPIIALPENAKSIALAACVLHNFLRTVEPNCYVPPGYADSETEAGGWRGDHPGLPSNPPSISRNSAVSATAMRERFVDYFISPQGQLEHQMAYVNRIQ